MDIWMESRFVSATSWHPDLFGALHLVDLQGSSPSSMLGATASLIRLKRNGVSGRGHLMPPLLVSQAGCGGRCPARRFAGGFPVEAPGARCHPLSLLLALVACPGSAAAGPTATGATGPASAEPPTAVRAGQPQTQTDRPLALAPTGRTPIPALNTRQISAMQQAQVSEIKTRHAPTSERVTPPPPLPAFPPPPAVAYPTLAPPTLVTSTARQDFPGPDIISTHGGNGLRFVESGVDRTPGEDRQYKSV